MNGKQGKCLRWLDERQKRGNVDERKQKSTRTEANIISYGYAGQSPWQVA